MILEPEHSHETGAAIAHRLAQRQAVAGRGGCELPPPERGHSCPQRAPTRTTLSAVPEVFSTSNAAADGNIRAAGWAGASRGGFTLLELMMVIAIIGIVAAMSVPTLRGLRPNAKVAGTRELLSAVTRARQLAISQRTTVYMVFVPTNFFVGQTINAPLQSLLDKQLTGYAFVSLRSVGDQPGVHTPQYLSRWETLPKGSFIPLAKFWPGFTITNTTIGDLWVAPFPSTNVVPFPSERNPTTLPVWLPYIAFDGTGQLVSGQPGQPELIPVAEGNVGIARDAAKRAVAQAAQPYEQPAGNIIDNYSVVYIDRLTGRAHVERRKVQ